MKIKQIITHAGMFHADEILGIALLQKYYPVLPANVVRTFKVTQDDLNDPETVVLDTGKVLDYNLANLDHHQNGDIPAACVLVLQWLFENSPFMTAGLHDFLISDDGLFKQVSDVDRGLLNPAPPNSFNTIIRGLNGHPQGFELAISFAKTAITSLINTHHKAEKAKRLWSECDKFPGVGTVINTTGESILGWTSMAEEEDILFMITPGRNPGEYNVISRNSELFPIEPDSNQTFLHPSRFIAAYKSLNDAMYHATYMHETIVANSK